VELYKAHNIDLALDPLEVAVCAQHNNGGLAGNIWYESVNIRHLFPIGEVNGSHGVTRPGGSALNAGQVAGLRAAEFIANRYSDWSISEEDLHEAIENVVSQVVKWAEKCPQSTSPWLVELKQIQDRMTRTGAHIRRLEDVQREVGEAWQQVRRLSESACKVEKPHQLKYAFRVRQLAFSQAVYLEAIKFSLESGVGSRGSAIVLDPLGDPVHEMLGVSWRIAPEDDSYRGKVLETMVEDGITHNRWIPCRQIPEPKSWFETTWGRFQKGEIYN
jgi:succinate dehydrogenase/fumarate reductase flavoprotein subunit